METKQAIELVRLYGASIGIDDFLETLQQMEMALDFEDLSVMNEIALKVVLRHGNEFFAAA